MASDFTRFQLDARKNLIKCIFADKKEYFYYRDLRDLILRILQDGKKENLSFHTLKFLDTYRKLVEKTKQEHIKQHDDVECCGGVFVMQAMRDDTEFQQAYKTLQELLIKRIESCHKKTNPAEQIMAEEEIRLVLFEKPGLISRCAKPSWFLQHIACEKSPRVIQFIDEPHPDVVDEVIRRDIRHILLIKPEFRTLNSEILALNAGTIKLNQINTEHKKRMIEFDYDSKGYWGEHNLMPLVQTIESQSSSLTPAQLEAFRLNAVGWHNYHAIKYIRNPSKAVKEKAIQNNPEHIEHIKFQYPALQELALFHGFRRMCRDENYLGKSGITLDSVYERLQNVMPQTSRIYEDLQAIYKNFPNITNLKHQNDQVHKGLLELARAKRVDARKIFGLFQNPSKDVIDTYHWVLEQQAEQIASEMRRKEFEKIFGLGL